MSKLMSWGRQYFANRVNEKEPKLQSSVAKGGENLSSIWEKFIKKGIEYDPFIDWYWSVIIISYIYQFIWTNKIVYCRNIGLSYEVNDTKLSPLRYQSMPTEVITPIWYMVVAIVGQIVPVTYWWSCVANSGLLKVVKSVAGPLFSR